MGPAGCLYWLLRSSTASLHRRVSGRIGDDHRLPSSSQTACVCHAVLPRSAGAVDRMEQKLTTGMCVAASLSTLVEGESSRKWDECGSGEGTLLMPSSD